jgi:hypothetical protein
VLRSFGCTHFESEDTSERSYPSLAGYHTKAKVANVKSYRWKQDGNAASQWDLMSCCPLAIFARRLNAFTRRPNSTLPHVFIDKQGALASVCTSNQMKI